MEKKILVALEHHFVLFDGQMYSDLAFDSNYWQEYLTVFDEVMVMARVEQADQKPQNFLRADAERVKFLPMKNYFGFKSFLYNFPILLFQAFKATSQANYFLLRLGNIGLLAWLSLLMQGRFRYACECMGDLKNAVASEKNFSMSAKIIGGVMHKISKLQVKLAYCSSYTSHYLAKTYPCRRQFVFSSAKISDTIITTARRPEHFASFPFRFVSVGRLEKQKGHHWLLEAAAELLKQKDLAPWTLDIIGPGSQQLALETLVKKYGGEDIINIVGRVAWGEELFAYLDKGHLFVLPSLTEGMPRALIEAMARGLPAIASNAGGIPELLSKTELIEIGNTTQLADKMLALMKDHLRLVQLSKENITIAKKYSADTVLQTKKSFWQTILSQ